MKKILIFFVIIIALTFVGCDFFTTQSNTTTNSSSTTSEESSTSQTTNITSTNTTTTTTQTTTESTTAAPLIIILLYPGQDTVEINSEWIDAGAKLFVDDVEYACEIVETVDLSTLGVYTVKYECLYNDTVYHASRYVVVIDQTPPNISLNLGVDTIKLGEDWQDASVTVTDNSLGEITLTVSGTVDTSTLGTYLITYTATDASGNTSSITRYVTVIE